MHDSKELPSLSFCDISGDLQSGTPVESINGNLFLVFII